MTLARSGFGTLLKMGDGGGPETFTTIAEVSNVTTPSFTRDTIDATHHTSPGGVREFIGSLVDPGEVTIDMNWIPSDPTQDQTTGLLKAALDGNTRNFRLVIPASPAVTWNFKGIVTGFSGATPMDDKMTASVTMKVSGLPTFS
jgi:predicted secreted protein